MKMRTVSFRVSADAARAYESASPEEKRKLEALVSSHLRQATHRHSNGEKSLEDLMSEMSRKAQERGLTPEKLERILNGR